MRLKIKITPNNSWITNWLRNISRRRKLSVAVKNSVCFYFVLLVQINWTQAASSRPFQWQWIIFCVNIGTLLSSNVLCSHLNLFLMTEMLWLGLPSMRWWNMFSISFNVFLCHWDVDHWLLLGWQHDIYFLYLKEGEILIVYKGVDLWQAVLTFNCLFGYVRQISLFQFWSARIQISDISN